jgi:hypothetical protein
MKSLTPDWPSCEMPSAVIGNTPAPLVSRHDGKPNAIEDC